MQFPLDCTWMYPFTSSLRACSRIDGGKYQMYNLLEEMKHHACHLKLLLCAFFNTVQFLRKKKNTFIKIHMFFRGCFYINMTYSWIRWSLTWLSFSLQQMVFYSFLTLYISYKRLRRGNNYTDLLHYFSLNQDKCEFCNLKKIQSVINWFGVVSVNYGEEITWRGGKIGFILLSCPWSIFCF